MIAMSPIVKKRKPSSVGARRVNGLQTLCSTDSESLWLSGASSGESADFLQSITHRRLAGGRSYNF